MGLSLKENLTCDVCVIGAGVAGLSAAYHLAKGGISVVVLDDGPVGQGETLCTTAHLSNAIDDRYTEMRRLHGSVGARLAAESHTRAIDVIEETIGQENIGCDFSRLDGYLILGADQPRSLLEHELAASHEAGLTEVRLEAETPLTFFATGPALVYPRQGQIHPAKYIRGLAAAVEKHGGRIYTDAHVMSLQGVPDAHAITDAGHKVSAGSIVVATNCPISGRVAIHTKQAPYTTFVIGAAIPVGAVPSILLWDMEDPYHYVRITPMGDHDLLIVGGADHKSGQEDDGEKRLADLERWARARFPMMQSVLHSWSGQVMETLDGLAYIGHAPGWKNSNLYVITGDSGMGMTHGTIGGLLISDLICGRPNDWADLYDPSRIPYRAAADYAKENTNVAAQYLSWMKPGDVSTEDDIAPGSGAVLRHGAKLVAVFRQPDNSVIRMSAVCPHLGCIVHWNSVESRWNCPCHGSKFSANGEVVTGPAKQPLSPVQAPEPPAAGESGV